MSTATKAEINRALFGKGYKPEHALQNTILQYLALEKVWAIRINSSAFVSEYKGKKRIVRSHSGGKGVADILAMVEVEFSVSGYCVPPRLFVPLHIEVKAPTGKQRPEQRSFQLDVEARGHHYLLALSIEDVVKELNAIRG